MTGFTTSAYVTPDGRVRLREAPAPWLDQALAALVGHELLLTVTVLRPEPPAWLGRRRPRIPSAPPRALGSG